MLYPPSLNHCILPLVCTHSDYTTAPEGTTAAEALETIKAKREDNVVIINASGDLVGACMATRMQPLPGASACVYACTHPPTCVCMHAEGRPYTKAKREDSVVITNAAVDLVGWLGSM